MNDNNESLVEGVVEGFYSLFFNRDLVYIFGGGLFVSISEYALLGKIDFPQTVSFELIGFLAISYVVGIALYHIGHTKIYPSEKYAKNTLFKPPYNYKGDLVLYQVLSDNYGKYVLNSLERYNYLFNIGYTVGSACLIGGGVVMPIVVIGRSFIEKISPSFIEKISPSFVEKISPSIYILLAIVLVIFGLIMLYYGKDIYIMMEKNEISLIEGIKSRKKGTVPKSSYASNYLRRRFH